MKLLKTNQFLKIVAPKKCLPLIFIQNLEFIVIYNASMVKFGFRNF